MEHEYPDVKIAAASEYFTDGREGFVIVNKIPDMFTPDGPVYGLPEAWKDFPERNGLFPTLKDAERALGMHPN